MEARSRSFEPVKIETIGTESGHHRFSTNDISSTPAIAYWRVNLTALSQRYNLYFVAVRNKIQVYRPDFPYQALGGKPALTIIPQLAKPDARGYINSDRPHDINHLIVGDLGNQEIVLLATDSGNVGAYYTRSIDAAIEKDPYQFSADANADFVGIRPFFSQWVGESAWGLAIHKEGRMIAVSANTPHHVHNLDLSSKVTVFAFALTIPDGGIEDDMDGIEHEAKGHRDLLEWRSWPISAQAAISDPPKRNCNYKIVLAGAHGHSNNIPSVTFVNSPEDHTGSWLLSTDITGQMKMWQVWKGSCFKSWCFNSPNDTAIPWTATREAGWLVAALDINAFRPAESMEKFIGHGRARQFYGYRAYGPSYDITDVVQRFTPQNSVVHPLVDDLGGGSSDEEDEDELNSLMDDSDDEISDRLSHRNFVQIPEPTILRPLIEQQHHEYDPDVATSYSEHDTSDDSDTQVEDPFFEQYFENVADMEDGEDLLDEAERGEMSSHDDIEQWSESPTSPTSLSSHIQQSSNRYEEQHYDNEAVHTGFPSPPSSSPRAKRLSFKYASDLRQSEPECDIRIPVVPIFHCSNSHVRLLGGPNANYPHVFCARMLRQTIPPALEGTHFSTMDRLNMLHQIPELGIVLIATQLGRCAVCSLTKRTDDGLLGFRVDWILPTKKQEREGARPVGDMLHGIAVSPIQGHESPYSKPFSPQDTDQRWTTDRIINGTLTTFDSRVVVLRTRGINRGTGSNNDINNVKTYNNVNGDHDGNEPISKDNSNVDENAHISYDTDDEDPNAFQALTVTRRWKKPDRVEGWRAHESSRRYRLMLTYSDMTVLTYELSRGIEREDIHMVYQ